MATGVEGLQELLKIMAGGTRPGAGEEPIKTGLAKPFEIVDLAAVPGVQCPCGTSHRGFSQPDNALMTLHMVEISANARTHYHKYLTEIYYFLECDGECRIELDGTLYPVRPGVAILIRPGTRHRAVGKMKVLNVVMPPFDKDDEWFD